MARSVQTPLASCLLTFVERFTVGQPLNMSVHGASESEAEEKWGGGERALRDAESALKVTQQGWDTSLRFLMPDPSSPASYAAFGLFPKTQGRFRILISCRKLGMESLPLKLSSVFLIL